MMLMRLRDVSSMPRKLLMIGGFDFMMSSKLHPGKELARSSVNLRITVPVLARPDILGIEPCAGVLGVA